LRDGFFALTRGFTREVGLLKTAHALTDCVGDTRGHLATAGICAASA